MQAGVYRDRGSAGDRVRAEGETRRGIAEENIERGEEPPPTGVVLALNLASPGGHLPDLFALPRRGSTPKPGVGSLVTTVGSRSHTPAPSPQQLVPAFEWSPTHLSERFECDRAARREPVRSEAVDRFRRVTDPRRSFRSSSFHSRSFRWWGFRSNDRRVDAFHRKVARGTFPDGPATPASACGGAPAPRRSLPRC